MHICSYVYSYFFAHVYLIVHLPLYIHICMLPPSAKIGGTEVLHHVQVERCNKLRSRSSRDTFGIGHHPRVEVVGFLSLEDVRDKGYQDLLEVWNKLRKRLVGQLVSRCGATRNCTPAAETGCIETTLLLKGFSLGSMPAWARDHYLRIKADMQATGNPFARPPPKAARVFGFDNIKIWGFSTSYAKEHFLILS